MLTENLCNTHLIMTHSLSLSIYSDFQTARLNIRQNKTTKHLPEELVQTEPDLTPPSESYQIIPSLSYI